MIVAKYFNQHVYPLYLKHCQPFFLNFILLFDRSQKTNTIADTVILLYI